MYLLKTSSNKIKKNLNKEIRYIEETNKNLEFGISIFKNIDEKKEQLDKIKTFKLNAENYLSITINNVIEILNNTGFIDNNNITELGLLASQFQEIHPLAISLLLYETNYFNDLSAIEIIVLISCLNNIKVSDEVKIHNPNTESIQVNKLTNNLYSMLKKFYDMENFYNVNTGSCYDINYDIQKYIMKWCESNTEIDCKVIIDLLDYECGIFVGEFVKIILKINNIANEIGKAAEITNNLHLLEKINKIPELTLKYIANNNSMYV